MSAFSEHMFTAPDGVRTYYRRYPAEGETQRVPVVCLHGLTRNSRDFEDVAPRIAAQGRLTIVVDVRGRGRSDSDPNPENYHPGKYVEDFLGLLDSLKLQRVVCLGTSMGGLMTMIAALARAEAIAAAVLNDIGPVIDPKGLARIQSYVGGAARFADWEAAAEAVRAVNAAAFPNETGEAFWLAFARRVCREIETGEVVLDYDPAIAKPVQEGNAAPPDLWPAFEALKAAPILLVRGALSDLLTKDTVDEMARRHHDLTYAEVPDVGHAPLLTEPAARRALDAFFARID